MFQINPPQGRCLKRFHLHGPRHSDGRLRFRPAWPRAVHSDGDVFFPVKLPVNHQWNWIMICWGAWVGKKCWVCLACIGTMKVEAQGSRRDSCQSYLACWPSAARKVRYLWFSVLMNQRWNLANRNHGITVEKHTFDSRNLGTLWRK